MRRLMDAVRVKIVFCDARSAGCGKTCAFASLGAREIRFDCIRWMQCESRSCFAMSTGQECIGKCQQSLFLQLLPPAKRRGSYLEAARLPPAMRHRRLDLLYQLFGTADAVTRRRNYSSGKPAPFTGTVKIVQRGGVIFPVTANPYRGRNAAFHADEFPLPYKPRHPAVNFFQC